jgi:hypothetical protein
MIEIMIKHDLNCMVIVLTGLLEEIDDLSIYVLFGKYTFINHKELMG